MNRSYFTCGLALALLCSPAVAGGLAILETVLTDNGDNDGFADTNETVTLRLRVQNTSGVALENVSITLRGQQPHLACLTTGTIQIGDLAAGEVRLSTEAFVFKVSASADRTALGLSPFDNLSATFDVVVASQPGNQLAHPPKLSLDLDLDASGGAGPTTFFESFENGMGAFEVQNLDQALVGEAASDGYRCQYNDPDGLNSFASPPCYLGNIPGQSEAVFWGLSGPKFSPEGGRGFTGFNSLFFGIDLGPPENWTTPLSVLEAARTAQPIRLGLSATPPVLSIKHQVSLLDSRASGLPEGTTYDRGVVMAQVANAQGNPVGPWFKIYPYQNEYDQTNVWATNCTFDPTDDGTTEDHFYDPSDPERLFGPSSTCQPEPIFANIGETSEAFVSGNVGLADGPGLPGFWGIGTWVESKFDLGRFRGRQIRVRFLASALAFSASSWQDIFPFNPYAGDDGWWIDDVTVTGAVTTAATVAVDTHDNSSLPAGLPDSDGDGLHDSCDNCAALTNVEQYDRDFDGVGNVCDFCITDPTNLDPDSDGYCNLEDNCPQHSNADQHDADDDDFGAICDCDDGNSATYPGAVQEVNDGEDNQCPGDAGYGAVDEITGTLRFLSSANENELYWTAQPGATKYQMARATARDFTAGCTTFEVDPPPVMNDPAQPAPGVVFYYLVRAVRPNMGSWGLRSDGQERIVPCD